MLDFEQTQNKGQMHLCQTTCPITRFGTLSFDKPIYIAPDFFNKTLLSQSIQRGVRVPETRYENGGQHDR